MYMRNVVRHWIVWVADYAEPLQLSLGGDFTQTAIRLNELCSRFSTRRIALTELQMIPIPLPFELPQVLSFRPRLASPTENSNNDN